MHTVLTAGKFPTGANLDCIVRKIHLHRCSAPNPGLTSARNVSMNMLLTGSASFIGSDFIRYVLCSSADPHVSNSDRLAYAGSPENRSSVASDVNYQFIKGDVPVVHSQRL